MVLYMIGLGLGDEDDITVKGLKVRAVVAFFPFFVFFLICFSSVLLRVCTVCVYYVFAVM